MEASTRTPVCTKQTTPRIHDWLAHDENSKLLKTMAAPETSPGGSIQSFLSGPSRRFQPTGDGGGGGGCSKFELCSNADAYLGCREDSIALAMSWLKVDEARTEGRKLTCGMFAAECV